MPTLREGFRRGIRLGHSLGNGFGHIFPITSLTTTTIVCDALKMGEPGSKYQNWYMVRRDAASAADRVRQVVSFDGSTGTLTHAGANYSDTTATSEYVELYPFSPITLDQHAQAVLPECRRYHRDIIPAHGGDTYYLGRYSWVWHSGHIQRLLMGGPRNLVRNPDFDDWNSVQTDGSLHPSLWTLSGSGGTFARSTSNPWKGPYELEMTRSGTNVVAGQSIADYFGTQGLLGDGVGSLVGKTIYGRLIFRSSLTSGVFLTVSDGVSSDFSDTQVALDGTHVYVDVDYTIAATGVRLAVEASVTSDGTAYLSKVIVKDEPITDADMRAEGRYSEVLFGWQDRPPAIRPDTRLSRGAVYTIETWRPYPELDGTRLLAGSCDGDSSDIDVDLWAWGILAKTFKAEGLDGAEEARRNYDALRAAARWDVRPHPLRRKPLGPPLRRV